MKKNIGPNRVLRFIVVVLVLFSFPYFGFSQNKAELIETFLNQYFENGLFNGTALVAENGKVIFKGGFGLANMEWGIPNKPDTKFRIGSITKQFTSMLILQLVEEGKLKIEDKLSDCLPYYRKDTGEKVTVHHLLVHTSGIPSYTGMPGFFDEISRDPYEVDKFIKKYCSADLEFEPGSKFRYNNSGYFILGGIIEEITGKKYETVLEEKILKPLGMKNTGYDHHSAIMKNRAGAYAVTFDGYINAPYLDMSLPYAAGSLFSTVEDLYTWDQALYTNKLLSKKMMELMFKPHFLAMGGHYAYGWAVTKKKIPGTNEKMNIISHGGGINGFNTNIERLVDYKNLIVLFNNTGGANLDAMSNGIRNILFDKEAVLPKKSVAKAVYKVYKERGIEEAIKHYKVLQEKNKKEYTFSPRELNNLGYFLLRNSKIDDAVKIFKFNIELYPKSSNAHDSLAEAYLEKGDKKQAIKFYAKALELNPNNTEIIEKLSRITKEK